ncbi:MAG: SusC/RagA family TonB-linked outer membrane protein [Bacteroidales bacterium]
MTPAWAQEIQVTGQVVDAEGGMPLPGVNVVVQGTTTGAITDVDGEYAISVPSESAVLIFSFVGYVTQQVGVAGQIRVDVALEEATTELDEVVVTAYGTQTKRTVTGSIQTVSADVLKDIPVAQVANQLQGKVSGVQINQRTGTPGEALTVRIRNAGSINASSEPLYVVDGFPIDGDLTGINPEEIESISILKDASSTALYGSRGANGVILIETKSAKAGKTEINFSAYRGVQKLPQRGRVDMMNGQEFAQFKKETYEDRGVAVPEAFQNPAQYGEGTNWYDIMFQPATIQDYTLSFSSGTEKARASVVAGYT